MYDMANKEEKYVLSTVFWKAFFLLFILIGIVFAIAQGNVSRKTYDRHIESQDKMNDKFAKVIKNNNDLLIRVDERLKLKE